MMGHKICFMVKYGQLSLNYTCYPLSRALRVFLSTAQAFSGLNGSPPNKTTHLRLICISGRVTLSRDIFTQNLNWVINLLIENCYLENDLPSGLLESLTSLRSLAIMGSNGVIEGAVASDSLAGMTGLLSISINAQVSYGSLPSGVFDGLVNLTMIHLRNAALDVIPLDLFKGLVNLKWIHLSYNNLQTLPSGLFDDLISLMSVGLDNNPWNCSCELMWLLDWANIAGLMLYFLHNTCCSYKYIQKKFNDSNTFGTMKLCSRQG